MDGKLEIGIDTHQGFVGSFNSLNQLQLAYGCGLISVGIYCPEILGYIPLGSTLTCNSFIFCCLSPETIFLFISNVLPTAMGPVTFIASPLQSRSINYIGISGQDFRGLT